MALLAACCFPAAAHAAPGRSAWQFLQPVEVAAPGMVRLELPPATLDASQPALADLRLIAPDGTETPWLLEETGPPRVADRAAGGFRATLDGRTTVLTAEQDVGRIVAVTLESPAPAFLKSARVEGSDDGTTWQTIVSGEVVFRQKDNAERLRVPFPPTAWRKLRITLDDARTPPVAFTGLRVSPVTAPAGTSEHPLTIAGREQAAGTTRLTLALGARNLHLAELKLEVPAGVFRRHCEAAAVLTETDGRETRHAIGSGTLYRVLGEDGNAVAGLAIPLHQRIAADSLLLTIADGDSPPLDIRAASATRYPDRLLFFANKAGTWQLLTGNRRAAMPDYDLGPLRAELARAPGAAVTPGALRAKPDYQAPPALPGVEPAGSGINLAGWARRRPVEAKLPGVVSLELDAETLAHVARSDLGDLRLIQGGKQVPWLLGSASAPRDLTVQVGDDPDPKRPGVSRWRLTLPLAGLPVQSIALESPDPLFTRDLRVLQQGKDELGNPWTRVIGSATWTRTPGAAAKPLRIPLGQARVADTLWLETENGDNPPIQVSRVSLRYQAPSIIAKVASADSLFLYYDNPHAEPPVYDLDLVRGELLAADKQVAKLGEDEILEPSPHRRSGEVSAGSPWLWAALAVVVVALLLIVAKLLPKQAA